MPVPLRESMPRDADLVRAAQRGDAPSLGVLLSRHHASMRAVAVGVLGPGADVDDAVQDASIIALRRVGDVREPEKVGAWLRAVVRNSCKALVRTKKPVPVADVASLGPPRFDPDPAALLERSERRDWVWHAVDGLPPDVRLATVLRYFTDVVTYDQIAQISGVPIGTIRSRLHQGRRALHSSLLHAADGVREDIDARTAARRREAEATLRAAEAGDFGAALTSHWHPDVHVTMASGLQATGFDHLMRAMDRDLDSGVRQRLTNVVAGRDIVIWEAELLSPPDDPFHCPPSVTWVQFFRQQRVGRLVLVHPRRRRSGDDAR
jgi:RNA polymerase sigma factor (sigma-70 family)